MNCKPGDLAVIVRSVDPRLAQNIGLIIKVVRPFLNGQRTPDGRTYWNSDQPRWLVHSTSASLWDGVVKSCWHVCFDASLRPIRDQPGADQTLTWKPVPQPVPEKEQA
jgi:hypothetical protein